MAILPTKNELKDVSLETLTTYCEMLQEEVNRRKMEEKQKISEEVVKKLEEAFDFAKKHDISVYFEDEEQLLSIDYFHEIRRYGGSITVKFD